MKLSKRGPISPRKEGPEEGGEREEVRRDEEREEVRRDEERGRGRGRGRRRKERTTLALTKSPNLKQSPILILSLSVNLISANLITPVKSSLDSGTGLLFDIWMVRVACCGARREIVPVTYLLARGRRSRACITCIEISIWDNKRSN
jgi:hypothetical protein